MPLADAARQIGTTAAAIRRAMAEEGREGEALARDVAAAVAAGERLAISPEWARVAEASAEAHATPPVILPPTPDPFPILAHLTDGKSKRASEATDDGAPDWEGFRRKAYERYGPGRTGLYLLQDERLIAAGMPATSPWWRWAISGFFDSGLTWFVPMVGRGAGKSTNLEKLLLTVVLLTERNVPPGQPWTCPFMSVVERDAVRRIIEIRSLLLNAYGLELKPVGGAIKVRDCCGNEIEIISTAGTIGQTSGPTTVAAFLDEAAKMHTASGAANLDSEVIASIVGTSRELDGWVGVRCSSAFETRGAHFANVMEGTNSENYVPTIGLDFIEGALAGYEDVARWETAQGNTHGAAQIRAFAKTLHPGSPNIATWVARPTLTALKSRMKLETLPKDDPGLEGMSRFDYWIREYGSMPLSREGGTDYSNQCLMAAGMTERINMMLGTRRPPPPGSVMAVPGARPGDARHAAPRGRVGVLDWKKRRTI